MSRPGILFALAALAACSGPAPQKADAVQETGAAAAPAPSASPAPPPRVTPPLADKDPGKVLLAWAKAMSVKDWDSAYLYWEEKGAGTGLTLAQFKAKWGKLANPEFELHHGQEEGAAGSLYYTAPLVLIDGKRIERGEIVLRRVNDVPGATPEQLRWHIESLTIEP